MAKPKLTKKSELHSENLAILRKYRNFAGDIIKTYTYAYQEKKYSEYLAQEYEPIDESTLPQLVDIRAIKAYADSKGVSIVSLSEEEKQQFLIPNPHYRKKRRHSVAAVF